MRPMDRITTQPVPDSPSHPVGSLPPDVGRDRTKADTWRAWAVAGWLCLLVFGSYANSLHNAFVYDDTSIIRENDSIRHLDQIPGLFLRDWWAGTEKMVGLTPSSGGISPVSNGRYRPLVVVSYALNYAGWGLDPVGYHLVNVFLHFLVTCLLYALARGMGLSLGAAAAGASLFAVHPIHTEAVNWIVSRPELMMSAGVLSALWLAARGHPRLSLIGFTVGLFSKEQAAMTPLLLVLYDACLGSRVGAPPGGRAALGWAFRRYGGYAAILAVYLLVWRLVAGGLVPPTYPFVDSPFEHLNTLDRIFSVVKVAGRYLWLMLWPASLSVDYGYRSILPATSLVDGGAAWGFLSWAGLAGLAAWGMRRDRRITFSVGLTVLTFFPTSNLLFSTGATMGERWFYLPSAGLCLLLALGCEGLLARYGAGPGLTRYRPAPGPRLWSPVAARWIGAAILAALCLTLAVRTAHRNRDWLDGETLFASAVRIWPDNAKAHTLLGHEFKQKGDPENLRRAIEEYRTAFRIFPGYRNDAVFAASIGEVLLGMGEPALATEALERAVELNSHWFIPQYNLSLAYALRGDDGKAEESWRRTLALNPDDPRVSSGLSRFYLERREFERALAAADLALQVAPRFLDAHVNRALALEGLKRPAEAADSYRRALALAPDLEEIRRRLQRVLRRLDHPQSPAVPSVP